MKSPLRSRLVAVFAVILSAGVPAQEKLVLPDDPLAAIARMPAQEPAKEGQRVQVVDENGKPLAGVSVVAVPVADKRDQNKLAAWLKRVTEKHGPSWDLDKAQQLYFAILGQRFVTDKEGVVLIPNQSREVLAVRGKDTVHTGWQKEDGVIKLVLLPDLPIHVLVVGPNGRPMRGVPVIVSASLRSSYFLGLPEKLPVKTDNAGRAQLHWGMIQRSFSHPAYVRALVAMKKPVAYKVVDPRKFKNDAHNPIKLTMPAFGQVRVYVMGKDKKPLPGIDGASLTILTPEGRYRGHRAPIQADSVKEDSATFSVVGVGLLIEVSCTYQGSQRPQKTRSEGPRHHMDMRVITIKGVTAPTRVKLRLLGLDGKPVVSERVGIIFMQGTRFYGLRAETDAEGRLNIVVPNEFEALQDGRLCLVRRLGESGRESGFLGSKELSFERLKGKKDGLGDVRLQQEELLASGQVVDKNGKPVPDATVSIDNVHGQFSWSPRGRFFQCQTKTDKDGRFELRALDANLGSVELRVSANNYLVQSGDEVEAGTKDHKVVLARTQTIHGRILYMKGMNYKGVKFFPGSVRVLDKDGVELKTDVDGARRSIINNLEFHNCLPGEYTIEFKLDRATKPFLTIPGVKVEEGKPCRDPRMMNIDLSKYISVVKVTVVGPDKKPLPASVSHHVVREGRRRGSSTQHTNEKGVCVLILPKEGAHVSVQGRDGAFRSQRFPMLKEDVVVQLEPALLVKLQLQGLPKLPDNLQFRMDMKPKVRERRKLGDFWGRYRNPSMLAGDGKAELYVDKPGDYRLTLRPVLLSRRGRRRTDLNPSGLILPQFEVTVEKLGQGAKAQTVELKLDEDQLESVKDLVEKAKEAKKDGEDR